MVFLGIGNILFSPNLFAAKHLVEQWGTRRESVFVSVLCWETWQFSNDSPGFASGDFFFFALLRGLLGKTFEFFSELIHFVLQRPSRPAFSEDLSAGHLAGTTSSRLLASESEGFRGRSPVRNDPSK